MDKAVLMYFVDVLLDDGSSLSRAVQAPSSVDDDSLKRALNVQLEAIKGDVANIQHLLET